MRLPIGTNHTELAPNTTSYTHVHNNHLKPDSDGNLVDATVKTLFPKDLKDLLIFCMPNAIANGIPAVGCHGDMISSEGIFSLVILRPQYFNR